MEGSQSAMSRLTAQEGENPKIREMENDTLTSAAANNGLGKLVQRYQVCWEVWPEYAAVGQAMRQVGFELELMGSDKSIQFNPTCPESFQIRSALEEIASWILEEKDENLRLEFSCHQQSLSYSAARGNRPDVTLAIRILHRTGFTDPVDQCEIHYLERMKIRLRQLGAGERQWTRNSYPPTEALAAA
jgi:hypothetical protein